MTGYDLLPPQFPFKILIFTARKIVFALTEQALR